MLDSQVLRERHHLSADVRRRVELTLAGLAARARHVRVHLHRCLERAVVLESLRPEIREMSLQVSLKRQWRHVFDSVTAQFSSLSSGRFPLSKECPIDDPHSHRQELI